MHNRDQTAPNRRGPADDGQTRPGAAHGLTRRRLLGCGLAAVVGGAFAGLELVEQGVLPGRQTLDELDGACSVSHPAERFRPVGPSFAGRFFSRARGRDVGYTLAYPPGHRSGSALPLGIVLHGFGGDHVRALAGLTLAQALALKTQGRSPALPMALVAADGGGGYWNAHPGDDPMGMVMNELLPMCQRLGLGRTPRSVGTLGISMGGYGALLLAEKHPDQIAAVAAISPAVWTSYAQARAANAGAYGSAADFASDDVVTHTAALAEIPVRVASGVDDPSSPRSRGAGEGAAQHGGHRHLRGLSRRLVLRQPAAGVAGVPGPAPGLIRERMSGPRHPRTATPATRRRRRVVGLGALAALGAALVLVISSLGADQYGARVVRFTVASRSVHQVLSEVAVIPPGTNGAGRPLLVFLHGKGSDGEDANLSSAMFAALARSGRPRSRHRVPRRR